MAVNGIGNEGAKVISEMLKVNKTLASLNLARGEESKEEQKEKEEDRMTDNEIRADGAKTMSEGLKVNSTLTSINLGGEKK